MAFVFLLLGVAGLFQASGRLAADLKPGMRLVYGSNGQSQPPWSIDTVSTGLNFPPHMECVSIQLRRRPDRPETEETRLCLTRDTLYAWVPRDSAWLAQRPVGPGMEMSFPRASGDTVRYATGSYSEAMISGQRLSVLETTVTTVDSAGRPRRRLRERYAVTLATATGGVFEVADTSVAGGWRAERTFELLEIQRPPP